MLSTIGLRLACGKGMHRRAISSWGITEEDQCYRDRTFWALYCLEKNASHRAGRPSVSALVSVAFSLQPFDDRPVTPGLLQMLNDEEISAEWPRAQALTTPVNLVFCACLIKVSQLISLVTRSTSTVEAFQQSPSAWTRTITELDERKDTVEDYIRPHLDLKSPSEPPHPISGLSMQQATYIRLLYYTLVAGIHTVLTNPWSRAALNLKDQPHARQQVEKSTGIVAEASRAAIQAAQFIHVDTNTPVL